MTNINILYKLISKSFSFLIYTSLLGFILSLIVFFRIDWSNSLADDGVQNYLNETNIAVDNLSLSDIEFINNNKASIRLSVINGFNLEYNQNLFEKFYQDRTVICFSSLTIR
jgi:hypothetical protein